LRRLFQILRNVAQRLVHAEGHVPGLTGEDREHRGEFGAEHAAGKEIEEEKTTVKVRKPRIGTDCRMSSSGISTISAPPALGGKRCIDEGENDRADDRKQHPHGRTQRGRPGDWPDRAIPA